MSAIKSIVKASIYHSQVGEISQEIAATQTCEFTFIQPIQTLWESTNILAILEIIWQGSYH